MKKSLALLTVILLICSTAFVGCEKKEKPQYIIQSVVDKKADEAESILKEAGFNKILLTPSESSQSSMVIDSTNWVVVSQEPAAGTAVSSLDTEINLICEKTSEKELNAVNSEIEKLVNGSLTDATAKIKELGYTAKYTHASSGLDFTNEITTFDDTELAKWIIIECKKIDTTTKTVEFTINTEENIKADEKAAATQKALAEKLSASNAWQAVEAYGKKQYPYGFDLHWIAGVITQEAKDKNTWHLKATVTITNEYNAEAKMECEAYVTGTSEKPEVTQFDVY